MKLFACMCNQPQRLWAALKPVRAALIAQPPVARWGLAYAQGGDILLVRTPRASDKPVDLAGPLAEIPTDCAIGQAVQSRGDERWSGADNTPPYRYRRWMFAQTGPVDVPASDHPGSAGVSSMPSGLRSESEIDPAKKDDATVADDAAPRLLKHIPEFLRRNLRGRTLGELVFNLFLAKLHDEGTVDDPNLPIAATRRALAAAVGLVAAERAETGVKGSLGSLVASNGRSMVAIRLGDPLRVRRLRLDDDSDDLRRSTDSRHPFRGVLLVSGADPDLMDGFEEVPPNRALVIHRNLQFEVTELPS